ncbi:quinone oxidoreductase family protein [Mycolicibacterium goodii]|uniref:Zinc-binding alcohol dehydrogenase family protein n=1 Tax=Mycolicibacterium goodii TaxID=134601 RepID=A0ABS6HQL9_MYCGD|nr:zinc-binding alcohol dehydrogenase family protein [Mycolicibacterium goodii]MBU8823582.1 zinc-binding alcohol dehydrogenase family protein [Mycolicibacterium goodii]MBU8835753.1 zinc-binding alcohol dehydrogenase family protein [Mycolicibacterium goodii]
MKAAVVRAWGQAPVYADLPDPQPSAGAEVADVEACALTNLTKGIASGRHYAAKGIELPMVPGLDGVARLADGRRVCTVGLGSGGMMAERALIDPRRAVAVPEHVDSVTAAALPNPGMSAWITLSHAASVKPGDHVLVLGATGVTGSLAAQLARSMFGAGAVVAVGRDPDRLQWLGSTGAQTIRLGEGDLAARIADLHGARPFDAVLDYLWGEPAEQVLGALAAATPAGGFQATRYIQVGSMAGASLTLDAAVLRATGITVSGVGLGSVPPDVWRQAQTEALPKLMSMAAAGEIELRTQARPLSDIERIWTDSAPSGTRVVVTP